MSFSIHSEPNHFPLRILTADLCEWRLLAKGKEAETLIRKFAALTRMGQGPKSPLGVFQPLYIKRIIVHVTEKEPRWRKIPVGRAGRIDCRVGPITNPMKMAFQLLRISRVIAHHCELGGGLLVHGALVARGEEGVILAGPGGVGKTTASKRLPLPWRTLSDDASLIVKSPDGSYRAHPWPTWSRIRAGKTRESWDVASFIKLKAVFMLAQAAKDRVSPLSSRQAISELVDVSGQTFFIMANGLEKAAIRRINLMRFNNAIAISKKVALCRLEISRYGEFWKDLEDFLVAQTELCRGNRKEFRKLTLI